MIRNKIGFETPRAWYSISRMVSILVLSSLCGVTSCKKISDQTKTKYIIADESSQNNFALIYDGDKSGGIGPGVDADVKLMMENAPKLGFQPINERATNYKDSSRDVASKVGDDGTLLWFITTHGSPQGDLSLAEGGGMAKFDDVAAALREGRKNRNSSGPFRRLFVFIEACFSGNNVDGATVISQNSGANGGSGQLNNQPFDYGFGLDTPSQPLFGNTIHYGNRMNGIGSDTLYNSRLDETGYGSSEGYNSRVQRNFRQNFGDQSGRSKCRAPANGVLQCIPALECESDDTALYKELILLTSSSKNEYSYVQTNGSVIVQAFWDTVANYCMDRPENMANVTIGQFLEEVKKGASAMQQGQNPVYKLEPEDLSEVCMFVGEKGNPVQQVKEFCAGFQNQRNSGEYYQP